MLENSYDTTRADGQPERAHETVLPSTTLEFLKTILPENGIYYLALFKEGYRFPAHKAYTDLETMAYAVDSMSKSKQLSVYHACASYKKAVIEIDSGDPEKPKRKYRIAENWSRARSFWVDLDCGQEKFDAGQGYLKKSDAVKAICDFAKAINWPRPMLVDSGNGIHAYWPLTKDIEAATWCKVSNILKASLSHANVIADPSRTADFASILRPTGSTNRKYGNAITVTVTDSGTPTDPKTLADALIAYAEQNGVKVAKERTPRAAPAMNDLNSDLTAHLTQYPDVPVDANLMADKCAQVALMRDTKGDVSYQHWWQVIGLLTYCEGGRNLAADWTANREAKGHNQLDWDIKYDTWSKGPTLCETLEQACPGGCDSCPMRGKIKTPLVLGKTYDGASINSSISKNVLIEALPDWNKNKDGIPTRPMGTTDNLKGVLKVFGWSVVRFNEMTKRSELFKVGLTLDRHDKDNVALTLLGDDAVRAGMNRDVVPELIEAIAGENGFHPCLDWITSKSWDGNSRLDQFQSTLELCDPEHKNLRNRLLNAWMLQAIGALLEPNGVAAQGVLTIVAPQARNKTRWVESLCAVPGAIRTGLHIDPLNKDSVFAATGAWITEAGELDTTTRKADVGALKAFFTRNKDIMRPPYAKRENEYKRRTVFVGTVNGTGFLHDTTGNRRFWTIEVSQCKLLTPEQMQQVWAEYLAMYRGDERWFLDESTQNLLNATNHGFTATEPLKELIATKFDWQSVDWSQIDSTNWRAYTNVRWLTATEICHEVGYSKVSRSEATRAGAIVRELQQVNSNNAITFAKEVCRHSNGSKRLAVPKSIISGGNK